MLQGGRRQAGCSCDARADDDAPGDRDRRGEAIDELGRVGVDVVEELLRRDHRCRGVRRRCEGNGRKGSGRLSSLGARFGITPLLHMLHALSRLTALRLTFGIDARSRRHLIHACSMHTLLDVLDIGRDTTTQKYKTIFRFISRGIYSL